MRYVFRFNSLKITLLHPFYNLYNEFFGLIPVNLFVSAYFKVDNLYNYFENYSKDNFVSKVNSDIMRNMREFLTQDNINEYELMNIRSTAYRNQQIDEINNDYLNRLGIKITNITIESIHLDESASLFYRLIRQADILAIEKNMEYSDALKTCLVFNNKISENYNNLNINSDILVDGLKQLKRLRLLAND